MLDNILFEDDSIENGSIVYENFIKSILEKKNRYVYKHFGVGTHSNTNLFLPDYSSEWMEELLISFLGVSHEEGYIVKMLTTNRMEIDIELDQLSGTIYEIESHIAIYVGMGKMSNKNKCPYFFIRGKRGLLSWKDGSYEDLKYKENKFPITLLQNVSPRKTNINFEQFLPKKQEICDNFHKFTDTRIRCSDGEMDVNRFLLSKKSYYFMTYFTKYVNPFCESQLEIPKIDFSKVFMEEYIRFLILKDIDEEKIEGNVEEWIKFGSFIQDFKFVKYIYDKVWNKCDRDSQLNLNEIINICLLNNPK
jgi:hypothetical protein